MATATLVLTGANRLRYLIAAAGTGSETVSISTIGSATPDTLTDSIKSGIITKLSKVVADGYGVFASGVQTQAKARGLWESLLSAPAGGADPSPSSPAGTKLPTAKLRLTTRTGSGNWGVIANVSANNPILSVTVSGGGTAYLDVFSPNAIGV